MTSFAWAIIAAFVLNAVAAFFAGCVIGGAIMDWRIGKILGGFADERRRIARKMLKLDDDAPYEAMRKRMDEAHEEDEA